MRYSVRTRRGHVLLGIVAVVVALAAAGCSGDNATTETTDASTTQATAATTTAAPTTTTAAPTSTTAAPTTTTAPTTTEAPATTTAAPATTTTAATTTTLDTNALASGAGCTPGSTVLPDGVWFGFVASADPTDLEFDLACWFVGDAAVLASAEDGEESPPPNDYYIRNVNPQLRTIPVASAAAVSWLPSLGDPTTQTTVPYADWLVGRAARTGYQPGVWVTIAGGEATFIEEQWVP